MFVRNLVIPVSMSPRCGEKRGVRPLDGQIAVLIMTNIHVHDVNVITLVLHHPSPHKPSILPDCLHLGHGDDHVAALCHGSSPQGVRYVGQALWEAPTCDTTLPDQ